MGHVQVVIDGMTGSGKTTLVNTLAQRLNLSLMPEEFRDPYDLLDKFSRESKWCYPMQLNFLMTRYIQYTVASEYEYYILDRSIFSDPVYAKLYYQKGYLSGDQYRDYTTFFNNLVKSVEQPKCLIFLSCPFDTIMHRIENRGRQDELRLSEDYWRSLYSAYEEHLENMYTTYNINYLEIDNEEYDFLHNEKHVDAIIAKVKAALKA